MDRRRGKHYKIGRKETGADKSLELLFEHFYHAKIAEGRAERTLEMYRESFRYLCGFMTEQGLELTFTAATTETLRSFIAWMLHSKRKFDGHPHKNERNMTIGLSPVTVNTKFGKLRTMFTFWEDEGLTPNNPCAKIRKVKEPVKEMRVLSSDEFKLLLSQPDQRTYVGFRDYVIMNVLIDTMARINEVLSLTVNAVDMTHDCVYLDEKITKSRRGRTVPIQRRTARLMAELRKECADFETDWLFCTNYGGVLTDDRFRDRLKKYAKMAGLSIRVHPHLFRHSGATLFLKNGGTERYLSEILGHSDQRMVSKYTHLAKNDIKEKHEMFTPMNNVISGLNKPRKTTLR